MHLKELELRGYKTFASRTQFHFETGITAIVGPNGSGKSNVADAIRWVLGEQSYSLLRGKKTEDMIFAGSEKRARAGMAQATIVLDNSDGLLPVEFSEVAITRRAYRSGENEYLLNNSRVRLRDINALLASSGLGQRTYNVIGQGLVDAALSLRAGQRRALFEEAAGISLYQERRQEALDKLETTRRNLERVEDILGEIRPRMRRLERQATRSREHNQVRADLDNLLYLWYGYHWESAKQGLRQARQEAAEQESWLQAARADQSTLEAQLVEQRQAAGQLRNQLGNWHRKDRQLHRQAEKVQRNLAVHAERLRLLGQQQDELALELGPLQQQREKAADQLATAKQVLAQAAARWQEQQAAVRKARKTLDVHRREIAQLRRKEQRAQREQIRLEEQAAGLNKRGTQLERERARSAAERKSIQTKVAGQITAQAAAQAELDQVEASLVEVEAQLAQIEEQRATLRNQQRAAQARYKRLRAKRQGAAAQLAQLEAQRRALADLRARGAGHNAAVQQLLAEGSRTMRGVIGPVAQLLQVPAELETAIAAALGGELSALVVENWAVVQQVLNQAGRSGRLVLLPLDELRPLASIAPPDDPAVLGAGASLVNCAPAQRPVVDTLLGRVLLVHNLASARRLAPTLSPGSCAVTLDGIVVAQDGRVRQSGQESERGLLAQERVWRVLPQKLAAANQKLEQAKASVASEQLELEQIEARLEQLDNQAGRLRKKRQAAGQKRQTAALQLDRLTQNIAWRQKQISEMDRRTAAVAQELLSVERSQQQVNRRLTKVSVEQEQLGTKVAAVRKKRNKEAAEHSARERALAQTEGARQNQQTLVDTHQNALKQLNSQLAGRQRRIQAIARERERLDGQMEEDNHTGQALTEQIAAVSHRIAPAEVRLTEIEECLEGFQANEKQLRRRVRGAEQAENHAQLTLNRRENNLEHLRSRIKDELGLVHLPLDEDISGQTPLPLGEMVGQLPVVKELPAGLEESIQRRKQQLKRMGAINPNAPAEFAELEQRYTFLSEQTSDLQEADAKLRQVIAELDTVMEREFKRTFKAVARHFKEAFTRLFGGGSARLHLTEPDTPLQSGVEILARPPGRRQQGLALLSGGERSLTAAALVFSLLKVSPTPFCVLDEVDAMLDEANVGRFQEMLSELSRQIQFIVITHNRGTVQAADTIYGASMGADGASQVISLRLHGQKVAGT